MTSSSTSSASSNSRPRLLRWLLIPLVPAVIFGVWWLFFQLFIALGIGDTEPKPSTPTASISVPVTPGPGTTDGNQSNTAPSTDISNSMKDAEIGVDGGHLLDPASNTEVPYWQAIIDQVALDPEGSLVVIMSLKTPPQDRSVIEPQAVELCQRFAEELTDGATGFTLMTRDGDALASNLAPDGVGLTECYMP